MRAFKLGDRIAPLTKAAKKYGEVCSGNFVGVVILDYGDGNYKVKILDNNNKSLIGDSMDVDGMYFYSKLSRSIYRKNKYNDYLKKDLL